MNFTVLSVTTLDEAAAPRVGMTDLFGYNVRSDPVAGKHLARVIGWIVGQLWPGSFSFLAEGYHDVRA